MQGGPNNDDDDAINNTKEYIHGENEQTNGILATGISKRWNLPSDRLSSDLRRVFVLFVVACFVVVFHQLFQKVALNFKKHSKFKKFKEERDSSLLMTTDMREMATMSPSTIVFFYLSNKEKR